MTTSKHEARARTAFGPAFHHMAILAIGARLRRGATKDRCEADAHESSACAVGDDTENAIAATRARLDGEWSAAWLRNELRERWARIEALLLEARAEAKAITKRAAEVKACQYVVEHSDESRARGRPSVRAWFVRAAAAKLKGLPPAARPARPPDPGDWASLGIALGIESADEDFEILRKAYADLLAPGKPRRGKISRARRTRADR
jgi:hypothetical protein